jgi:hypothetical protein
MVDKFASDPIGYSSIAWEHWAIAQEEVGIAVDSFEGPSALDLNSSVLWLCHARAMESAAQIILRAQPDTRFVPKEVHKIFLSQHSAIGLMLLGYSLEICLKAQILIQVSSENYIDNQHNHHDLCKLAASANLKLSEKENAILKAVSHFIRWAGRYPNPGAKRFQDRKELLNLSEKYKITARDLFTLSGEMMKRVESLLHDE